MLREGHGEIRNADIRQKLDSLAQVVRFAWLQRAIKRTDEIMHLLRRNIQRGIALDAMVLDLRG